MTETAPGGPGPDEPDELVPAEARSGLVRLLARYGADVGAERAWLGVVRRGRIVTWIGPQDHGPAPLPEQLVDRIIVRRGLLVLDDVRRDAMVDSGVEGAPEGALLSIGCTDGSGELSGVLVAHASSPRTWTNLDLERGGDVAQAISALLEINELRLHAERRVAWERRARRLRVSMHRIAVGAAAARSLAEIAAMLTTDGPRLLECSWVALVHREGSDWMLPRALLEQLVPIEGAGDEGDRRDLVERMLDQVASQPSERSSPTQAGATSPTMERRLGRTHVAAVSIEPASDELDVVLIAGFDAAPRSPVRLTLEQLAEDVGVALDRIIRARRSAATAATLQRSLLPPRLPDIDGLAIRAVYDPAADHSRVGGDWYDVVVFDDGAAAFVVGDVAGHDVRSAALMGQVRHVLASQLQYHRSAASALHATDRYFHELDENVMATAVVVVVEPGAASVRVALAGHPPPVHVGASGPRLLEAPVAAPIGFGYGGHREAEFGLEAGDLLVAYTDGVIEQFDGDLGDHVDRLLAALAPCGRDLEAVVEVLRHQAVATTVVDDAAALAIAVH